MKAWKPTIKSIDRSWRESARSILAEWGSVGLSNATVPPALLHLACRSEYKKCARGGSAEETDSSPQHRQAASAGNASFCFSPMALREKLPRSCFYGEEGFTNTSTAPKTGRAATRQNETFRNVLVFSSVDIKMPPHATLHHGRIFCANVLRRERRFKFLIFPPRYQCFGGQ